MTCWGSPVPVNDSSRAVALLARPGQARERLRQALDGAGVHVVLEADPNGLEPASLSACGASAVLVALEPAVEDALEALGPVLEDPALLVVFDEAELAARRDGWEAQRWIRHLSAKLHGHDDVLPPGREHDLSGELEPGRPQTPQQGHAGVPLEPYLDEAEAVAAELPRDEPGVVAAAPAPPVLPAVADWALTDEVVPPVRAPSVAAAPPPLPDVSRLSLVELESEAEAVANPAAANGAILVLAGIGGPDAVRKLLGALPPGFQTPVLVQLRLDGGRYDNLVKQMARVSPVPVALAMTGDPVAPGSAYVLPDGVGIDASGEGLRFGEAGAGDEPVAALPPANSAVLVLSGADPARMDAVLALSTRGAMVAGQALDGCYDATAVKLLEAGGAELAAPAALAAQLVARWG